MVTRERLIELLNYDPETGIFFWKKPTASWLRCGDLAGSATKDGAVRIKIDGRLYLAHRLAWLYFYGDWPERCIDHINRDRSDNRISNLRLASRVENGQNSNVQKNNKSGVTGVYWRSDRHAWRAEITVNKKKIILGSYQNKCDAINARSKAEEKFFPFKIFGDKRIEEETNEKKSQYGKGIR